MKIIILGLGTAGFAAMMAAKRTNPSAEITLLDKKDFDLLHNCGLPYALEGVLKAEGLKHKLALKQMNVNLISSSIVKNIDFEKKSIEYRAKRKKSKLIYDRLIIATGSSAFIPPIKNIDKFLGKSVFPVENINDIQKISKKIKKNKTALIIGAGAIGIETAFALGKKGMKVIIAEMLDNVLPKSIDKDMAEIVEEQIRKKGTRLLLQRKVEEFVGNKGLKGVKIGDEEIKTDLIIASAGVRPNIDFIDKEKIKTGSFGILTDKKMQTNLEDVYAVGDCVQVDSVMNGKRTIAWLANSAYIQGTVAGINAAGGNSEYPGTSSTFVTVFGDMEIASTGFTSELAQSHGYEVISGKFKGKNLPEWYPGGKEIIVKILADKFNGKLIGGQAIGKDAGARINVIATAISAGMSLENFTRLELAYCPPVSDVRDVLMFAADQALRKLELSKKR